MTPKVAPKFSVCRVCLPVMGFLILAGVCLCLSRTYGPPRVRATVTLWGARQPYRR